jgi:hypothetical protein
MAMGALQMSIIGNIGLVALLLSLSWFQQAQLREAKLATFAEMLRAISYGAAHTDLGTRFERLALALSGMLGGIDAAEIRWRLLRASMIGYLGSREPALADLVNGKGRLVILRAVTGDDKADEVWSYIDSMLDGSAPLSEQIDPAEVFTDKELKLAQLQLEADLLRFYHTALRQGKD